MNRSFTSVLSFAVVLSQLASSAQAWGRSYVVKVGDTLSRVAETLEGSGVYVQDKKLAQVLAMNPQIVNPNQIYIGQIIELPGAELASCVTATDSTVTRKIASEPLIETKADSTSNAVVPAEKDVGWRMELGLDYRSSAINLADSTTAATGSLYSKLNAGLLGTLLQDWSKAFSTFESFDLREVIINPAISSTKTLSGTSQFLTRFEIGALNRVGSSIEIKYGVCQAPGLFVQGINSSTLNIDAVPLWSVNTGVSWDFLRIGGTTLGASLGGAYILGKTTESYTVNSGTELKGAIYLKKQTASGSGLTITAGGLQKTQNTSILDHQEQSFGLGISYTLPVFSH